MAPTLQSDSRQIKSRRVSKHLTERKRRARINDSLLQLKTIVYPAVKDEVVQNSKMEKADILDMTLRYVKDIQQKKREGIQPSVDQFHAGYSECLSQVSNFLTSSESMSLETRRRLLTYLADKCLTGTAMDESKQTGSHLAPPSPTETRISPPPPTACHLCLFHPRVLSTLYQLRRFNLSPRRWLFLTPVLPDTGSDVTSLISYQRHHILLSPPNSIHLQQITVTTNSFSRRFDDRGFCYTYGYSQYYSQCRLLLKILMCGDHGDVLVARNVHQGASCKTNIGLEKQE
ncbi:hairy and enhancer of split transcription factor C [Apostichopus japonicus]|uniref:Hairy and enhancer of split transcription factor C n=1 Tax=Stichopus japonicus TaxID=307972 RepID=A0A2G8LFC2_STIJA|nr:hairy and enhancer of split transcription factor C [Apostichopus japonicus]